MLQVRVAFDDCWKGVARGGFDDYKLKHEGGGAQGFGSTLLVLPIPWSSLECFSIQWGGSWWGIGVFIAIYELY